MRTGNDINDIYHKESRVTGGFAEGEHAQRNAIMDDYTKRAKEHLSLNGIKKKEAYNPDNPFAEWM